MSRIEMPADRAGLDTYLQAVNETMQTTKLASEVWLRAPRGDVITANDKLVFELLTHLRGSSTTGVPSRWSELLHDAAAMRTYYWDGFQSARPTALHFGANDHDRLEQYFHIDPARSTARAISRVREAAQSAPARTLLRTVEHIAATSAMEIPDACRAAMDEASREWTRLASAIPGGEGRCPVLLGDAMSALYHAVTTDGLHSTSPAGPPGDTTSPEVSATDDEARDLARVTMLSRLCYTDDELEAAAALAADPRVQNTLIATQLDLLVRFGTVAELLVATWGTTRVLLPFTEAFVNQPGYDGADIYLVPNPKLLTVMSNNLLPAIAAELLHRHAAIGELRAADFAAGARAAVRRGAYNITIGLFHGSNPPGTVVVSGFNKRVCPAVGPFTAACVRRLPYFYDHFGAERP